ncbi:MAG TPA: DNA adenine methylase [Bacteroidota bacterium]|nr:DNA adenine methylase [Bacteroidota bacterium]
MKSIKYKSGDKVVSNTTKSIREQLALFETNRNLDFKGSDTQYSTHALHTYVAAMVPQLAEALVTTFTPRGERVLDPFCGGGAVLVECVRHGRKGTGSDINPLGVLVSKVKSTFIERKPLQEACQYVKTHALRNINGSIAFPEEYNVDYWFLPRTMAELSALISVIKKCERTDKFSRDIIDALKAIFSATVRDVMLTYRNEVRLRRLEPQDLQRFQPNAFESFALRSRLAIERIPNLPRNARTVVECHPVQQLPFPDKHFHSIICSPPYGDERNGVSYLQFSKYMLYWLGFSRASVMEARKRTLGSEHVEINVPSETLEKVSKLILKNDSDLNWINFYKEYYLGLQQMIRVTRENIIIVIGNRILKQTVVKNGKITTEIMHNLGWRLKQHFERTLPSKRLPKLRREANHGFGGAIDKEDILIFTPRNK